MTRVLVVDNHDSFAPLLHGYLEQLGAQPRLVRQGDIEVPVTGADAVLLTSGDGSPRAVSSSRAIVAACAEAGLPLLGVGHGHHAVATAFGAAVARAAEPMHGKTTAIDHDGTGLFVDLPTPLTATCYHSFVVAEPDPDGELRVTARGAGGVIMALVHRRLPVHSVQFHPEAALTEHGHHLLGNWLTSAGDPGAAARGASLAPLLST